MEATVDLTVLNAPLIASTPLLTPVESAELHAFPTRVAASSPAFAESLSPFFSAPLSRVSLIDAVLFPMTPAIVSRLPAPRPFEELSPERCALEEHHELVRVDHPGVDVADEVDEEASSRNSINRRAMEITKPRCVSSRITTKGPTLPAFAIAFAYAQNSS
jgi:hypothetical protein